MPSAPDMSGWKFYEYEGWVAGYDETGEQVVETDNFVGWLQEKFGIKVDSDVAYGWHDDPELGGFPEILPEDQRG